MREHEKPTFSSAKLYVHPFIRRVFYLSCKKRNREFAYPYKQLESAAFTSRVWGWKTFKGLIQHLQVLLRQAVTTQGKVSQAAATARPAQAVCALPSRTAATAGASGGSGKIASQARIKEMQLSPFFWELVSGQKFPRQPSLPIMKSKRELAPGGAVRVKHCHVESL